MFEYLQSEWKLMSGVLANKFVSLVDCDGERERERRGERIRTERKKF